jgi:hypothetical protein
MRDKPDIANHDDGYENPADYVRPSERIFRRSRAARMRRSVSNKSDFKLVTVLLQFSVLMALILVGLGAWTIKQLGQSGSVSTGGADMSALARWTDPWLLGLSRIEVIGMGAIGLFCLFMLRRWRRSKRRK